MESKSHKCFFSITVCAPSDSALRKVNPKLRASSAQATAKIDHILSGLCVQSMAKQIDFKSALPRT